MEKNLIWNIIARYFAGESTPEEEKILKDWEQQDKLNAAVLKRLGEMWQYQPEQMFRNKKIYRSFRNRLNYHEKRRDQNPVLYVAVRAAAIFLLLVTTAVLVHRFSPALKNEEAVTWQEVSVPRGSRTSIILSDSSKVWISNNTTIRYPNRFTGDSRELELSGEAYFEVTHHAAKPFIVNMGNDRIRVLGTKFSVTAYPEDKTIRADLLTGKIMLDIKKENGGVFYTSYQVQPAHSLVYEKTSGKARLTDIPEGFFDYWKKGIYTFKDETLGSLAQKIDRIYNVKLVFEDAYLKTKSFSGSISIDDNIFTFMEAIKRTSLESIDYRYEDRKIFIKLNKK